MSAMEQWQETYTWACAYPDETVMDGEMWWQMCIMNILAQAFQGTKGIVSKETLKAPAPEDAWKSAMLTGLYNVLFDERKLTIGQFKQVLEAIKPEQEKLTDSSSAHTDEMTSER